MPKKNKSIIFTKKGINNFSLDIYVYMNYKNIFYKSFGIVK
jgi:hypothetical protein